MKEVYTPIIQLRRQVFAEVARLALSGDFDKLDGIPYKIIPGETPTFRESVFKERAIVAERLRLACGLSVRKADESSPISSGLAESAAPEKYYEPPLINVIPFACDACEETAYEVTNHCRVCIAHACVNTCPAKAVSIQNNKSEIDKEKCVKCGKCAEVCPYNAIIKHERPCASACGVDAIGSDALGRAQIDYDKCVSCGQCMVNCPFGAIADKSQIFQLTLALKTKEKMVALVAPSFAGQFGPNATPGKMKSALQQLGFDDVYEVAMGADIGSISEAHHYAQKVATGIDPFVGTSCCPAWSVMAKKTFPEFAHCISYELTPMVATARIAKREHPDAKVTFIGPCSAKKLEASRKSVRSDVDFVITFEELMGMFVAKEIDFATVDTEDPINDATAAGRGYAVAGGVSGAIVESLHILYPEIEVNADRAQGLRECRKMLMLAKAGKRNGYLLEGMGCPGGCVAGAGTIVPVSKAAASVKKHQEEAEKKHAAHASNK